MADVLDRIKNRLFVKEITSVGIVDEGDNPGATIPLWKRNVSTEERDKLADKGQALPDGSFPIANTSDLKNAIQAFGRAGNKTAVKAHIIRRAKALKATDLLPETWNTVKVKENSADSEGTRKGKPMAMPDLSTVDKDLRTEIEKAFTEATDRIDQLEKAAEETPEEDILKGLPDEAKAILETLEKKAAATEEALAKERDHRLTAEAVEKARPFAQLLGDPAEAGPMLKSMPSETVDWLVEKLTTLEAQLAKSALFAEIGKSDDDVTAVDQIEKLAKEKVKDSNGDLTMTQAKVLVRNEHPDLKAQEREERNQ